MILRDGGIFTWPPKWYLEALKGWQWLKTSLGPLHGGICGGNIVEYHGDEGVGGGAGRAFVLQATKESEHGGQKACHVCCTLPVDIPFLPSKIPGHLNQIKIFILTKNTHPPTQPPTKCWSWKLSPILCHKSQLCMFFFYLGPSHYKAIAVGHFAPHNNDRLGNLCNALFSLLSHKWISSRRRWCKKGPKTFTRYLELESWQQIVMKCWK